MAQSGLGREHMNKCGHQGCSCMVEPSQGYCSEHCAQASSANTSNELPGGSAQAGGKCQCGHSDCKHS